jgi:hypothetical protein
MYRWGKALAKLRLPNNNDLLDKQLEWSGLVWRKKIQQDTYRRPSGLILP